MRSRFERANGPTCAWSSTFQVRSPPVGSTSPTSCTRSIHVGYARQVVDERERPLGRTGHRRVAFDLHRCRGRGRHSAGRSAVRKARDSSGLRAESRPSRSSASSNDGVHGPTSGSGHRRCRPRRESRNRVTASAPSGPAEFELFDARSDTSLSRRPGASGGGRAAAGGTIGGPDLGGRRASSREAPPSSWHGEGTAPPRRDRSAAGNTSIQNTRSSGRMPHTTDARSEQPGRPHSRSIAG